MIFEIIFIENSDRKSSFILTRAMDDIVDCSLTDHSTLGGVPIKPFVSQPRTTDKNGNLTFEIFAFYVKNKSDLSLLKVGQLAELIP